MDFVSRLKRYIDHKGLQNSQVADMAGIPRPTLSQLLTGRNKKVSNELIEKLHQAFPQLNVLWLLFGDGDMELGTYVGFSEPQNGPEMDLFNAQDLENEQGYDAPTPLRENAADNGQKNESRVWMAIPPSESGTAAPEKRVKSIMVFYSDNSYEVFEPVRKSTDE